LLHPGGGTRDRSGRGDRRRRGRREPRCRSPAGADRLRTGPTPLRDDRAGLYRWVEHTSEVELEIEAASEGEVLADAVAAIAELLAVGGEAEEARAVSATAD